MTDVVFGLNPQQMLLFIVSAELSLMWIHGPGTVYIAFCVYRTLGLLLVMATQYRFFCITIRYDL